jgi:hypothetical protein
VTGTAASGGASKVLIVKADSSQSVNLQEWQDSTGTALASVSASGNITGPNVTGSTSVSSSKYTASGSTIRIEYNNASAGTINFGDTASQNMVQFSINRNAAGRCAYYFYGGASNVGSSPSYGLQIHGSGNAVAVYGSTQGTGIAYGLGAGALQIASGTTIQHKIGSCYNATDTPTLIQTISSTGVSVTGNHTVTANSATVIPIVAKGTTSQSVDLMQWQDVNNNILSRVYSTGAALFPSITVGASSYASFSAISTTNMFGSLNSSSANGYCELDFAHAGSNKLQIKGFGGVSGDYLLFSPTYGNGSRFNGSYYFGGVSTAPTAVVHIVGSTTSAASLRVASGTAPTSPNDGDIWYDGSYLQHASGRDILPR